MTKDEQIIKKEKELLKMVDDFSNIHLDEECSILCSNLVKKLGRKREVPFKRGKLTIWASAVIHTISHINFLFDEKFTPHITLDDISEYFNTNKSTVGSKSKFIRDSLKIKFFDFEFTQRKLLVEYLESAFIESDDGELLPLEIFEKEFQKRVINELIESKGKAYKLIPPIVNPYFLKTREPMINKYFHGHLKYIRD